MKRYGGFSLTEINRMIPYEFEIYTAQVLEAMKQESEARKKK